MRGDDNHDPRIEPTVLSIETARAAFLRACALDVAVRKPGNVSRASAGHRMRAEQFIASAKAAAGPLFTAGARVGARIEAAGAASWQAAGCNTNLGIVLLAAPIARAVEQLPFAAAGAGSLRRSISAVLADLDRDDAAAAFRAIVQASPGGLGSAAEEDVHSEPTIDLRSAMALAAPRDRIAAQYVDGYAACFDVGTSAFGPNRLRIDDSDCDAPGPMLVAAVQRIYLALLADKPDSHIVRIHGEAVAQTVMSQAQGWNRHAVDALDVDADLAFAAWDDALKAASINPGTTADLTVATLFVVGLVQAAAALPLATSRGTERDNQTDAPVQDGR
jgi:triphosphoribosyl-dephospho-CoA synthase